MDSITIFYLGFLILFLVVPILQICMNPASIVEVPSTDSSMEVIDRMTAHSVALFSIVLVIIQFILRDGAENDYRLLTVAMLVLCAGFLMTTFILELFGGVRIVLFHLQITALRYAGLLLFTGLYYLLGSYQLESALLLIFDLFLSLAWITWLVHEANYLLRIQRQEWRNREISRKTWFSNQIDEKKNSAQKYFEDMVDR